MALKLYGVGKATCTKRVAVVLHEKKIPFELIEIDVPSQECKSAAYLEKQPFGQVPYLDDDGFILFESRAIACYLEAKYHDQVTPLMPTSEGLKQKALYQQALSIEQSNFDPFASTAVFEAVFKELTLADLFHLPDGGYLPAAGYKGLKTKPNVARWWKAISSRPSWQTVKDGAKSTAQSA